MLSLGTVYCVYRVARYFWSAPAGEEGILGQQKTLVQRSRDERRVLLKAGKVKEYVTSVIEREHSMQTYIQQNREQLARVLGIKASEEQMYLEVRVKVKMLMAQKTLLPFDSILTQISVMKSCVPSEKAVLTQLLQECSA